MLPNYVIYILFNISSCPTMLYTYYWTQQVAQLCYIHTIQHNKLPKYVIYILLNTTCCPITLYTYYWTQHFAQLCCILYIDHMLPNYVVYILLNTTCFPTMLYTCYWTKHVAQLCYIHTIQHNMLHIVHRIHSQLEHKVPELGRIPLLEERLHGCLDTKKITIIST